MPGYQRCMDAYAIAALGSTDRAVNATIDLELSDLLAAFTEVRDNLRADMAAWDRFEGLYVLDTNVFTYFRVAHPLACASGPRPSTRHHYRYNTFSPLTVSR